MFSQYDNILVKINVLYSSITSIEKILKSSYWPSDNPQH